MEKLFYFVLILVASNLNNLIIPYIIYFKIHGFNKKREKEFIGVNMWGVIMDGILAGLVNILTLNYLLTIKPKIYLPDVLIAFFLGFCFMVGCHIYMSVHKWKIWIMPRPWHWNAAGYWHMVSMTIQMGYIAYCFIPLIKNPTLLLKPITYITLISCLLLGGLFIAALRVHLKGWKLGKLHISNEPW